MKYTLAQYIAAIERELAKRRTTYPRIIEKKRKREESERKIHNELKRQAIQYQRLETVLDILRENLYYIDAPSAANYLKELRRELKMREKVYKRFIAIKRITPEAAAEQTDIWRALVQYFEETYLGEAAIQSA